MTDVVAPIVNGQVYPSARAVALFSESHSVTSRALLCAQDGTPAAELPFIGGTCTCDSGATVRRTASLKVHAAWSDVATSALSPTAGTRVAVERGVVVAPRTIEWVRLMTGVIDESSQDDDGGLVGEMTVPLKDEFSSLALDRFDQATSTDTTEQVVAAIRRLITQTLPSATVIDLTGSTALCGKMDLQQDRAAAVGKLATSIGAECLTGRGWQEFVIRPQPTLLDSPRWSLSVGESGNLQKVTRTRKRSGVYNRVLVTQVVNESTGTSTTPPIRAEAKITDQSDPIFYGGPHGKVTRFYSSPLITTAEQAQAAADALLAKARGRTVEYAFTALVNPAMDGGDVVRSIISDGVVRAHITDSVSLPLSGDDDQDISTRTLELPDEQNQAAA